MNSFDEYQAKAYATAIYPERYGILYPALGLASEAGEVADKVKKRIRDHEGYVSPDSADEIVKELGDVLWYVANLAADLGVSMSAVADGNLEKLASRSKRGKLGGSGDNR